MKKWLFIGGVALVIIIGVAIFGLFNLGPIIKTAVNTQGPKITQTDVRVDDVGVSLFSGQATLKGLLIGNPPGFSASEAIKVGSVFVNLDKKTLTQDPIVISKITVQNPEINYEHMAGTDNFQTILKNIKQSTGGKDSSPAGPDKGAKAGKKLLIRDFELSGGKVALSALPGQSVSVNLPDIHLQNLGGNQEGIQPERAVREVLAAISKRLQSPDVAAAVSQELKKLNLNVEGVNLESLSDKLKQGGGALKGLLNSK
jgi:uncharacterized protein involved in outer membrane biogenesis